MAGQTGPAMVAAMRQVQAKTASPYRAAKANKVALSTMYRSALYKLHQAGRHEELERALEEAELRLRATGKLKVA